MSHVSVYAQFTMKDPPKDHRGLSSEKWNFGKERPVDLDSLIVTMAVKLALFYANTVGQDEETESINAHLKRAGEAIAGYYLKDVVDRDE